jgi:glycosyltransferase involved in cell wall biosynthesis
VPDAPRVSVVVPVHNAAGTIERALRSVAAQTFGDWELLVCDDGSTDGSGALAAPFLTGADGRSRGRVLRLGGGGAASARNHGIRAAAGEFVAFLDDDDWWEPCKLERCVAALDAGSLDVVCHSEVWATEGGGSTVRHYSALFDPGVPPFVSLMRNNPFSTSALVVRHDRLVAAGPFDEALPSAEDYDLWIRIAMLPGVRIGFIDEPLGTYLVRPGSESSKVDRRLRALLVIGERYSAPLRRASRLGAFEPWAFRAKTYLTSGLRLAQQGDRARGARLAVAGLAMWPFRWDLLSYAVRERRRRGGA